MRGEEAALQVMVPLSLPFSYFFLVFSPLGLELCADFRATPLHRPSDQDTYFNRNPAMTSTLASSATPMPRLLLHGMSPKKFPWSNTGAIFQIAEPLGACIEKKVLRGQQ